MKQRKYKVSVALRGYVVVSAKSPSEAEDLVSEGGNNLDKLWDGFVPFDESDQSFVVGAVAPTNEKATFKP